MPDSQVFISVVIPICNEEENIPELYRRLTPILEKLCSDSGQPHDNYEIIMVDDGSRDRSWELIRELHRRDARVRGITFARNFGHHIALTAGLDHCRGSAVILMDGDLQDPPEEIPRMYELLKTGYDLVYGIREVRNDSLFKKMTSKLFWWMLRRFSGVVMPEGQTMLRIMSRRMIDALKQMRERARFVHGMMAWVGFNVTTTVVRHAPRSKGTSKYNIPRMFALAFHAITSFSTVPLRLATYVGLLCACISMFIGLYFIYQKIFHDIPVLGYASIIVSIFFVGGVQLLMLGLFGEYLGRTYQEVQGRPLYITRETLL